MTTQIKTSGIEDKAVTAEKMAVNSVGEKQYAKKSIQPRHLSDAAKKPAEDAADAAKAAKHAVDNVTKKLKNVGTQSVVTVAPSSAAGFEDGHVWYVVD